MASIEKQVILRVIGNFIRTGNASDDQVKVICLPADKSSVIERTGEDSRTILLDEFKLDGRVIWASYSTRSGTVYLSPRSAPKVIA